jgi:O-antigen/teichoic acid export membrane protein
MKTPVGKAFLVYAGAFAIAGIIPFLLLPVLTRRLTPLQYGEITSFLVLAALLSNVAGLTANGFVSVRFFKTERNQFPNIVSSAIAAVTGAHVVVLVLVIALFPLIEHILELPFRYALLALCAALFINLNLMFLAIFQSSGNPWLYLKSRALQGVVELLLCMALLFLVFTDARARILSYLAAIVASAGLGFYFTARLGYLGSRISTRPIRDLLVFGVPMLPHVIAGSAITYLDRLVVSSLLGAESLGVYMVAKQIGMAMMALIEPLNKALAPWLFEQLSRGGPAVRPLIVKRTYQLFLTLCAIGVVIAVGAHFLFDRMIGVKYGAALPLIPWMIGGYVLQGMYYSVVNYMFYAERTGVLALISGSTATIGVAVSYAMASAYGIRGAGYSFLFNSALLFLLVWYAASRTVPMPWRLVRKHA